MAACAARDALRNSGLGSRYTHHRRAGLVHAGRDFVANEEVAVSERLSRRGEWSIPRTGDLPERYAAGDREVPVAEAREFHVDGPVRIPPPRNGVPKD